MQSSLLMVEFHLESILRRLIRGSLSLLVFPIMCVPNLNIITLIRLC